MCSVLLAAACRDETGASGGEHQAAVQIQGNDGQEHGRKERLGRQC